MECTHLFHLRVKEFLGTYIIGGEKVLGRVEHYVIRYEVQQWISLHAHIIFWLHKDDVDHVTNKITVYIPATYDEAKKVFIELEDEWQQKLFQLVKWKQLHTCKVNKCYKYRKKCKFRFPFESNTNMKAQSNVYTKRWEYYRPRYCDRNVVPYHTILLLIWRAHINIQRITSSY